MRGVYLVPRSPFYWIRYYDKYEPNPAHKRKRHNTKIEVTESDRKRHAKGLRLVGTYKLRQLLDSFRTGVADRNLEMNSGVRLHKQLLLSEGYAEFKRARSVPGSKKQIKEKTLINYNIAVDHFKKACGDKKIYQYTDKHFVKLLEYFEAVEIPGKKINEKRLIKKMTINTRSNYTRSLHCLWNYFKENNYTSKNIIETVSQTDKQPDPIPLNEMKIILEYFKISEHGHHFSLIYFLLLTGCRPSSAMVQTIENIDFKKKIIKIENVKTGARKGKIYYKFPLYKELEKLILNAVASPKALGRLFGQFKLNSLNYTYPLSFWERGIKVLKEKKEISEYYTLKQIRSTTASFLVNGLKMDIFLVKKILDHSDIKMTEDYVELDLERIRHEMDKTKITDWVRK